MTGQLLSLGSINVDMQMRVEQLQAADTVFSRDFALLGGGKGANVAYLASRLGVDTRLIGCVGMDALAQLATAPLVSSGVDLQLVHRAHGTPTGLAVVLVPPDGKKIIVQSANANLVWTPAAIDAMCVAIAAAPPESVLVSDLEVPAEAVEAALEAACARGLTVIVDPTPTFRVTRRTFEGIDYVTPNAAEAARLVGAPIQTSEDAIEAGRTLLDRGVTGAALIKLHDGGCALVGHDQVWLLSAPPMPVTDQTGAGDAFTGALAVALLEGRPLEEAARFAVAAATVSVTRYGAQPSYPTRAELDRFLTERAHEICIKNVPHVDVHDRQALVLDEV